MGNVLSVVLVVASFVLHVCYKDFLASSSGRSRVFESTVVAQDVCDVVYFSSFVIVRIFFLIILFVSFFVTLS